MLDEALCHDLRHDLVVDTLAAPVTSAGEHPCRRQRCRLATISRRALRVQREGGQRGSRAFRAGSYRVDPTAPKRGRALDPLLCRDDVKPPHGLFNDIDPKRALPFFEMNWARNSRNHQTMVVCSP